MSAEPAAPAPPVALPARIPAWVLPLLPLVSGVLFAYSLPPYRASWLGWVALVPLLWTAARLPRTLWAAGAGLATGLVAGLVQIGWSSLSASGYSRNYALAPFIWMAFVFAVTSAWAKWSRQQGRHGFGWVLGVAGAGTVAEWLTGFTPLPVGVALGQAENLPLIQLCTFTGVWGVSFLMYLINAGIANALQRGRTGSENEKAAITVFFSVIAVVLISVFGNAIVNWRHTSEQSYQSERKYAFLEVDKYSPHLEVAAVQDYGGPETATGDPPQARLAETAEPSTLAPPDAPVLMHRAAKEGARLIVGTENSFGASFRPELANGELRTLARTTKTYLIVGHEAADHRKIGANPFNCATLVGPGGAVGTHHKIHLFLGERQTMQAGDKATVAPAPWGKTGLLICFQYISKAR